MTHHACGVVRLPDGRRVPCRIVHPVKLPLPELGLLAEIYKLERQELVPSSLLNEWLSLNTPDITFDNDPSLMEKYADLGDLLTKYGRTVLDSIPWYIKRDNDIEEQFFKRCNTETAVMLAKIIVRMHTGPGRPDLLNKKQVTPQVSRARANEQLFYNALGNVCNTMCMPFTGEVTDFSAQQADVSLLRVFTLARANLGHLIDSGEQRLGSVVISVRLHAGVPMAFAQVRKTKKRKYWKVLNQLFPAHDAMNKRRQQFSVGELVWMMAGKPAVAGTAGWAGARGTPLALVNQVLRLFPVGTWNATVAGYLLVTLLLPSSGRLLKTYESLEIQRLTNLGVAKLGKFLTMMLRRTRRMPDGSDLLVEEMLAFTYCNLLSGRAIEPVDWEAEVLNRQRVDEHFLPEYGSDFCDVVCKDTEGFFTKGRSIVASMWKEMYTDRMGKEPPAEALNRRRDWATSGSDRYPGLTLDGKPLAKTTKRVTIEQYAADEILSWLDTPPREYARGSNKGEQGGARAIIAPGIDHYLIATYSVEGLENRLYMVSGCEKGLRGHVLNSHEQTRCLMLRQPGGVISNMLDYVDFNAQHDARTERLLFDVQGDVAEESGCDPTYVRAIRWHADSKLDKKLTTPDGVTHRVTKGLFSGTRCTDLGNTMCNQLYLRVSVEDLLGKFPWLDAADQSVRRTAYDPTGLAYRVHQGDDVFLAGNRLLVFMLQQHMINAGYELNKHKQLVSDFGEYLRKIYTADSVCGFPVRAIANLLTKKFESPDIHEPQAGVRAMVDVLGILLRRGCSEAGVGLVYDSLVHKYANVRSSADDKHGVRVSQRIVGGPASVGGWDCPKPGGKHVILAPGGKRSRGFALSLRDLDLNTKDLASEDYIKYLSSRTGGLAWDSHAIRAMQKDEVRASALGPEQVCSILDTFKEYYRDVNTSVGKTRHSLARPAAGPAVAARARQFFDTVLVDLGHGSGLGNVSLNAGAPNLHVWLCTRSVSLEGWGLFGTEACPTYVKPEQLPVTGSVTADLSRTYNLFHTSYGRRGLYVITSALLASGLGFTKTTATAAACDILAADRNMEHPMHGGFRGKGGAGEDRFVNLSGLTAMIRAAVIGACSRDRATPSNISAYWLYAKQGIVFRRPPPGEDVSLDSWALLCRTVTGGLPLGWKLLTEQSMLKSGVGKAVAVGACALVAGFASTQLTHKAGGAGWEARLLAQFCRAMFEGCRPVNSCAARALHKLCNSMACDISVYYHMAHCEPVTSSDILQGMASATIPYWYPRSLYAKKEAEILPISALMGKAIAASTFKSLAKTMVAFKLGKIAGLKKCLELSNMDEYKLRMLLDMVTALELRGDTDALNCLVDGIAMPRQTTICYLTGSVHSLLEQRALDTVLHIRAYGKQLCGCPVRAVTAKYFVAMYLSIILFSSCLSLQRY